MRAFIVVDLGFGDAGKGTITDWLVRAHGARLVCRFNGGAQAGHTVVLPDGRVHTFAQFGAGSFVPGVRTLLGPRFVLHPGALLVEADYLARAGVPDARDRLLIDPRATVISPFQQAAGRLRELARGPAAHGSCGVGVGEAVADALRHPDDAICAGLLGQPDALRAALTAQRARKLAWWDDRPLPADPRAAPELAALRDASVIDRCLDLWRTLAPQVGTPAQTHAEIAAGTVVFEGAQGALLDERWGFHPHTTWSDCTRAGAVALLAHQPHAVTTIGVTRCYSTRHGAGPMPSADAAWSKRLPEPHNGDAGWQGAFRVGPLDLPLLRYALACSPVDGVAITHLDRLEAETTWCVDHAPPIDWTPGAPDDLAHRAALGRALNGCQPVLAPIARAALPAAIADAVGKPVLVESWGPTHADKRSSGAATPSAIR